MRLMRDLFLAFGVVGLIAANSAEGQNYQPGPAMLRYPLPQYPATAESPAPPARLAQAALATPQYYTTEPAQPQAQYAYPATQPTAAPQAAAPTFVVAGQTYPGLAYPNTAAPYAYTTPAAYAPQVPPVALSPQGYYAIAARPQSVMVQNPAPPQPVAVPLPPTQPQPQISVPPQSPAMQYPVTGPYAVPGANASMGTAPMSTWTSYGSGTGAPPADSALDSSLIPPSACAPVPYDYPACPPAERAPCPWFGGVFGLYMNRDNENHHMFSYDDACESIQMTDSRDSHPDMMSGMEVQVGRCFNCGLNAIQAVYWGVFPQDGSSPLPDSGSTITTADCVRGNLDGILNWESLNYNGANAGHWVDCAQAHAIFRENEWRNLEINLLQFGDASCFGGGCGGKMGCAGGKGEPCGKCDSCGKNFRYGWLAGIRWFNFRDSLVFGADTVNRSFTYAPEELFYSVQTVNNLVGFQLGGIGQYFVTPRLSLDFGQKAGFFGNRCEQESWIGGAAGTAVINNGPNCGRAFDISSTKNAFSILGELDLGLSYRFTQCWTASAGYRAVGATGIALPTNQMYPDVRGINDLEDVDSNGSVIVHGGYAGLTYGF